MNEPAALCVTPDCEAQARLYGSQQYLRRDLCLGCFSAWFKGVSLQEDVQSGTLDAHGRPVLTPQGAGTPLPADVVTPVWKKGRNVAVAEKACDRCGKRINIRKNATGRHYPADIDGPAPHRCAP